MSVSIDAAGAPPDRSARRNASYAAASFAAFVLLGSIGTEHIALDRVAAGLAGHGVPVALFFTKAGLFPVFVVLCVLVLLFGLLRRRYLALVAVPVVALILAWFASDFFKGLFHRPRPDYWVAIHETSASYASGHAALSLTFYGLLAYIVRRTQPRSAFRSLVPWLAAVWVLATGWSRLALGAHYLSDVLGGYMLGATFVLLGQIAIDRLTPAAKAAT